MIDSATPKTKADRLVCWQCGGSLQAVRRPIRHGARCPSCRADLHVCRQCRHYAPKVRGECDHERADRVIDKSSANYCTHFRPARGAHRDASDPRRDRARDELADLFGLVPDSQPTMPGKQAEVAADARRRLDDLFGIESGSGPESARADDSAGSEC